MLADKHISWVLYLSRQNFSTKSSLKITLHTFIESYFDQEQDLMQKYKYQQLYHALL